MDELGEILQQLLRFSPDALVVVDSRGMICFANETTSSLFGHAPADLLGKSIEVLVPNRFHIRHGAHILNYMRDPIPREMGVRISDLFAKRADGTEFPAGIRLAPFRVGTHSFIAAAIRDMSERRAISDALVSAREEADRANRAKSRFLATASHDLRQPLQAIRLLNASMLKMTLSGEVHGLLQHQEQAIDRMTRLLNALLDISRLESDAVDPQYAPIALSTVYEELGREFASVAASKDLKLTLPQTDLVLSTDQTLFSQLLQNLIGNALKYTELGSVRVQNTVEQEALIVVIEDTGVGIPEDKLERIFDEYYQVDTHGAKRLGVGLGLAIVREVAKLLGYSINVTSQLGQGTRIRIRIPRQHLVSDARMPVKEAGVLRSASVSPKCRIVLLEDNDSVRIATELFLTLEGYDTQSAGSVAEAEPLLENMQDGDVLVTDYHLENKITGLDVLEQLRARKGKAVPAILLSGDLQSMLRVVKTVIPNCRFLSKPVDTRALLEAITELSGMKE